MNKAYSIRQRLALAGATALLALAAAGCSGGPAPIEPAPDPQIPQLPPRITAVAGEGTPVVTVTAEDPNGDDIIVTAAVPEGLRVAEPTQTIAGGAGTARFEFSSGSLLDSATGSATFTVADAMASAPETRSVTIEAPALEYADDTLYAIPLDAEVQTGEPVTILVATGKLPRPLMFMTGVRVVAPGLRYVPDSFNVGAPGGQRDELDGFWNGVPPFFEALHVPDAFLQQVQNTAAGRALDFNVTPVKNDGSSLGYAVADTAGELFTFQVVFTEPGEHRISFEQDETVKRTYYNDAKPTESNPHEFYWGDIGNDHPGVPNTVVVTGDALSEPQPEPEPLANYEFSAEALPASYTHGGSADGYSITYSEFNEADAEWAAADIRHLLPDLIEAKVHVENAAGLTALYLNVSYETDKLRFEHAWVGGTDAADWIVGPPHMMQDGPSNLRYFAALPNPQDQAGFTGDGVVARLYFAKTSGAGPAQQLDALRPASAPDTAPSLILDGQTLSWGHSLRGDYNQDGSVDSFDFLPMAYHFGAEGGPGSLAEFIRGAAPAVHITALTGMGVHWRMAVDGYNIYSGAAGDHPDGGSLIATVDFAAATGDPAAERLRFSHTLDSAPTAGTAFWVKPAFDGAAGPASNMIIAP